MKKLVVALSMLASISSPAIAEGDIEAGKAKSALCAACHGPDGNSVIDMYPKIAGQNVSYLEKQLIDFRSAAQTGGQSGRNDPIMAGMTIMLSDDDIKNISAYYASQTQTSNNIENIPPLGEQLYKVGEIERGITACIACHGPKGQGMAQAGFPMISGQHASYIKSQLNKFSEMSRNNDLNGMMQDVSKKLTPADIEALSLYISNLK